MTIPGMDFRCLSVSTLVVSSLWCQLYSLNGYWSVVALRGPVLAASQASVQQKKTIAFWSNVRRPVLLVLEGSHLRDKANHGQ